MRKYWRKMRSVNSPIRIIAFATAVAVAFSTNAIIMPTYSGNIQSSNLLRTTASLAPGSRFDNPTEPAAQPPASDELAANPKDDNTFTIDPTAMVAKIRAGGLGNDGDDDEDTLFWPFFGEERFTEVIKDGLRTAFENAFGGTFDIENGFTFPVTRPDDKEEQQLIEEVLAMKRSGGLDSLKPVKNRERNTLPLRLKSKALDVKQGCIGIASSDRRRYIYTGDIRGCVAVTLYCKKEAANGKEIGAVGSVLHFEGAWKGTESGLNAAFTYLTKGGVEKKDIEARIIGGDEDDDGSRYLVYKLHELLGNAGIKEIVEEDLFSEVVENIFLDLETGELYDADIPKEKRLLRVFRKDFFLRELADMTRVVEKLLSCSYPQLAQELKDSLAKIDNHLLQNPDRVITNAECYALAKMNDTLKLRCRISPEILSGDFALTLRAFADGFVGREFDRRRIIASGA